MFSQFFFSYISLFIEMLFCLQIELGHFTPQFKSKKNSSNVTFFKYLTNHSSLELFIVHQICIVVHFKYEIKRDLFERNIATIMYLKKVFRRHTILSSEYNILSFVTFKIFSYCFSLRYFCVYVQHYKLWDIKC